METRPLPCFQSSDEFFSLIFKRICRSVSLTFIRPANKLLPDFREKLILAITGINNCAYFSFLHTRIAIENGVKISEVKRLLEGNLETFPEDEVAALLYAQHWTETRGAVSAEKRRKVIAFFGHRETKLLESVIMFAHFSNLCSNTVIAYRENRTSHRKSFGFLIIYLLSTPFAYRIKKETEAVQ